MVLARVEGTVVSSRNADRVHGGRYLVVRRTDEKGAPAGEALIALDLVRADRGQTVLVSQGSSARQTDETSNAAVDAVIVGIVDEVHVDTGEANDR